MPPLSSSQAVPGRSVAAPSAPRSPNSLPFPVAADPLDRLAKLLNISRDALCAALVDAVAPMVVEAIDDAIDEHGQESHQSARRGTAEAQFAEFKNRYPRPFGRDMEPAVRAAFFRFPWTGNQPADEHGLRFPAAFWEGFERWLGSEKWTKEGGKYIPGALKFLQAEHFREHNQVAADGRLSKGETQRRREAQENEYKRAILTPTAAPLAQAKALPAAPPDIRSSFEIARDALIAAFVDPSATQATIDLRKDSLRSHGPQGAAAVVAIETNHAPKQGRPE